MHLRGLGNQTLRGYHIKTTTSEQLGRANHGPAQAGQLNGAQPAVRSKDRLDEFNKKSKAQITQQVDTEANAIARATVGALVTPDADAEHQQENDFVQLRRMPRPVAKIDAPGKAGEVAVR